MNGKRVVDRDERASTNHICNNNILIFMEEGSLVKTLSYFFHIKFSAFSPEYSKKNLKHGSFIIFYGVSNLPLNGKYLRGKIKANCERGISRNKSK